MNRLVLVALSVVAAGAVIGGAVYYRYKHPFTSAASRPTPPATTTAPSIALAKAKPPRGPATQILDILRDQDSKYPTTHRLETALDLKYAAPVVLRDPVYLDNQGNLWVTRPDAPEKFNFIKASASETATHVVRDEVVFAFWGSTTNGKWMPHLVVRNTSGAGYELVDYGGRRRLADLYGFRWDNALVLPGRGGGDKGHLVVPTRTGACAFAFDQDPDTVAATHQVLVPTNDPDPADRAVQLVMDVSGVIAYVTNAAGTRGVPFPRSVARFAQRVRPATTATAPATSTVVSAEPTAPEYRWTVLASWPANLLHLVPLLDGSVLQIVSASPANAEPEERDKVKFSLNSITKANIDRRKVLALVQQLSASDPEERDAAFKALTTYGPGIAAQLEQLLETQPVEAQIRMRQLLKNKIEPSLGSMSLTDGRMRVVNRLPDGGVIFYAEGGVTIPRPDDSPSYVAPAWLSVRPGRAVELLPGALVTDLSPDKHRIIAWGLNDYVVQDPVMGPQWFIGNHREPLLRKGQRQFTEFDGIDTTGRWIFRESEADVGVRLFLMARTRDITPAAFLPAATQPSAIDVPHAHAATLLIDPHLPDPTPRLPGWQLPQSAGKVGWDKNNWPVIYMDVKPDPIPWALEEGGWRVLDPKKDTVLTDPASLPKPVAPPRRSASRPATSSATTTATTTTSPTTTETTEDLGQPLLVTPDGTAYYDGRQTLKVVHPDRSMTDWTLPASAVGAGEPTLLRSSEGLLFLFNEPGRIVRIRPTPDDDTPFNVEAVFTRGVPSDASPQRIWLDPADRICIAHGTSHITIVFPIGRIPPAIAEKMRPEDFPPDEP